jgi:hypothetical protein
MGKSVVIVLTALMPKQLPIHLIDFVLNNAIGNTIGIKLGEGNKI